MKFEQRGARRRSALRLRSALPLFTVLLLLPASAAAQLPQYEEGIVEVVAERLPPLPLVVLVDSAGSILLPIEHITYYLGLTSGWEDAVFSVPAVSGGMARVDTVRSVLSVASDSIHLAPAEFVQQGPLLYLRAERLATLLEARVHVDFSTLTVVITRESLFPAQQRIVAEQRRAILLARQRQLDQRRTLEAAPYAPVSGAGILDWNVSTSGLDPTDLTTLGLNTGAALLGGDIGVGGVFEIGSDAADSFRDATLRYHRVFPQGRYVSQFSAGDLITTGLFGRFVRGAELSNRPFLRSAELSAILVQPDLPAGWEYEVFQGNQLLGYSDLSTFDPVAVPLRTGTTPVQVRMYGPAGQEVITTLLYQTPISLVLRDAVEYSLGAGKCASSCEEFVHADVRYGATALFTAGGGFELFRDTAGSQLRPYLVASMATGRTATAELTYMPFNLYAANIGLFPRDGSRANLRGSISRPGLGPISLVTQNRRRWDVEALWDERIERTGARFSQLRFGASAAGLIGRVERWRVSSTASFSRGFLEARYDHDNAFLDTHMLTGRVALYVPFSFRSHPLRPLLNAALGVGGGGLRLGEAGLSLQAGPSAVINAGAQWNRGNSQPALSIGYTARTGSVQSALRAVTSPRGGASSSFRVSGSTAFARDGSVTHYPSPRSGYAGLLGTVFIDRDGNGIFTPGDEPVPGAHLVIGTFRTASDEDGRYRVWGMQPYQPVSVAIDSARTPDPSLTTSGAALVVRPAPNMARRVDVPLVRTSELIGTVTASADVATAAGISLDITHLDSGAVTTAVTFSDGFYYVSRLRPGTYRLAVSPSSLEALAAAASPGALEFTVPASGDELVVELPAIVLERR